MRPSSVKTEVESRLVFGSEAAQLPPFLKRITGVVVSDVWSRIRSELVLEDLNRGAEPSSVSTQTFGSAIEGVVRRELCFGGLWVGYRCPTLSTRAFFVGEKRLLRVEFGQLLMTVKPRKVARRIHEYVFQGWWEQIEEAREELGQVKMPLDSLHLEPQELRGRVELLSHRVRSCIEVVA